MSTSDVARVQMGNDLDEYLAKVCHFDWDDGFHLCGREKGHPGEHLCAGCDDTAAP